MKSPTPSPISDQAAGELLPCPFCGGTLGFAAVGHKDGCYIPMAISSFAFTREQYDEAWNRRSTASTTGSAPESLVFDDWFDGVYMPTRLERDRVAERHAAVAGWIAAHEHWGNTASPAASMLTQEIRSIEDWQKRYLPNGLPEQPVIFELSGADMQSVAIPPIFYNGDTKRDPALRTACDEQVRTGLAANDAASMLNELRDILMDQAQPHLAVRMSDALKRIDALLAASMGGEKS